MPVLLRDHALYWYDSLPDADKATFETFKAAFLKRYKTDGLNGWQDAASCWSSKQGADSVEEYINKMLKKTAKTKATPEHILYCIINGLRTPIRAQVLMHDVKTVDDVRRLAKIAESTEICVDRHRYDQRAKRHSRAA